MSSTSTNSTLPVISVRIGSNHGSNDAIISFYLTRGITVIGGSVGAYNGALLHAADQYNAVKSIQEDIMGLENAREIGRKMAQMLIVKEKINNQGE